MLHRSARFYFGSHAKFAVVGGGSAGLNVTAHLKSQKGVLESDIRVFEPSKQHYYQPGWSMVAGGIYDSANTVKLTKQVFPEKIPISQLAVTKVDPKKNIIYTEDGDSYTYEHLIIASGLVSDYEAIKGATDALNDPDCPVGSAYQKDYAEKMAQITKDFQGGDFVFQEAPMPIKCPGAPQKVCFLTEHQLRKTKKRDSTTINYYMAKPVIFGVPKYAAKLEEQHSQKNINVHLSHKAVEINKEQRTITFQDPNGVQKTQKFDALHIVPSQKAPAYIKESGLGDEAGFCNVDQGTLRHKEYSNVWALGDSSSCPTSKTAAAVFSQTPVLINNIMSVVNNTAFPTEQYDGYTSCPLLIGDDKVILAEFKYGAEVDETFPVDQGNARKVFFRLKKDFFPFAYWNFVNKGLWFGRKAFFPKIPFFNVFFK